MIPPNLNFGFDNAFYLIIGAFVIMALFRFLYLYRKKALQNFDTSVVIHRSNAIFWSKVVASALAWVLLVLAMMQPRGNEHYADEAVSNAIKNVELKGKLRKRGHEVLIFIDASASMDVTDTNNGQSRLAKSKVIADQIVSRLEGENVALYAFTSSTIQLSPPTLDYLFVRLMLRQININEGGDTGTDFMAPLKTLKNEVDNEPPSELKTAIIFSDGGDYRLDMLEGAALQVSIDGMTDQLANVESLRLRVFTVGVGSQAGGIVSGVTDKGKAVSSSLNDFLLKKMALKGRGDYFRANDASDVEIANSIIAAMRQDPVMMSESEFLTSIASATNDKIYDLYFQVPLGLALLLLAYVFLWPEVRR